MDSKKALEIIDKHVDQEILMARIASEILIPYLTQVLGGKKVEMDAGKVGLQILKDCIKLNGMKSDLIKELVMVSIDEAVVKSETKYDDLAWGIGKPLFISLADQPIPGWK